MNDAQAEVKRYRRWEVLFLVVAFWMFGSGGAGVGHLVLDGADEDVQVVTAICFFLAGASAVVMHIYGLRRRLAEAEVQISELDRERRRLHQQVRTGGGGR